MLMNTMGKNETGQNANKEREIILYRLGREGLIDKVTFEVKQEVNEGVSHVYSWGSMFRKRREQMQSS